jgi:homoserine kinase
VTVEAPASSANLGCGFDVFALALAEPKDRLTLQRAQSRVSLTVSGSAQLAKEPKGNVAGAVATAIMAEHGVKCGVSMTLFKGVPVGAGLGSSAASSVAAAVGTNRLFRLGLREKEIIRFAGLGERLASGTAHYDNVAASLAGGFVIVRQGLDFAKLGPPKGMALCLVTPKVRLPKEKTKFARSLLPKEVTMERAVAVIRAAGTMVHGFAAGNLEEIGQAMEESLVDDRRAVMIPGLDDVRRAAVSHGAAGVCISGAGPTLLAVCPKLSGGRVLEEMEKAFRLAGIRSSGFTTVAGRGCRVIER